MRTARAFLTVVLGVATSACLAGDAVVNVKGRFVDQDKKPYPACVLKATYRDQVVEESKIAGEFRETIIFNPTTSAPLVLVGTCAGAQGSYTRKIEEMPKNLSPVDLGDIVLQKQ